MKEAQPTAMTVAELMNPANLANVSDQSGGGVEWDPRSVLEALEAAPIKPEKPNHREEIHETK